MKWLDKHRANKLARQLEWDEKVQQQRLEYEEIYTEQHRCKHVWGDPVDEQKYDGISHYNVQYAICKKCLKKRYANA